MLDELYWTESSEAHVARHGVTPAEVERVVLGRPRWVKPGRDETMLVFGRNEAGRPLVVVVAPCRHPAMDQGAWYVVTAREMTESERRRFERNAR